MLIATELLVSIAILIIGAGTACACFYFGFRLGRETAKPPEKAKPEPPELTEEERLKNERYKRDLENLMKYDGTSNG